MSSFDAAVAAATMHHTGAAFECANATRVTARGAAFGRLMRDIEMAADLSIPRNLAAPVPKRALLDPAELSPPEGIGAGA